MKILVVLPRIPFPPRDGGAITMWQTLLRMKRMGHHVCVVAINASRHPVDPAVLHEIAHDVHAIDVDTRILPFRALRSLFFPKEPVGTSLPKPSYWLERFLDMRVLKKVEEILRKEPFDILQCESLFTLWYGVAIREQFGTLTPTVILHSHNVEYRIMESLARESSRPWPERLYRSHLARTTKRFEEEISRRVDGATVVSEDEVAWFQRIAPGVPVKSIPPGVTLDSMDVDVEQLPHSIGILASMEWQPNVSGTIWFVEHVMPILRERLPQVTLHIAGRNPGPDVLRLHDGVSVFVHGEVESSSIFRRRYSISVVPVFSGSGIRVKILESMGVGRPVVSTTQGAQGLEVTHGVNLLIADEPNSFAQSCLELLSNEQTYSRITAAGHEFVQNGYTWESSMNRLLSFYNTVILSRNQVTEVD